MRAWAVPFALQAVRSRHSAGKRSIGYEAAASLKQIREQLLEAGENYWALQVQIQEQAGACLGAHG